MRRHSLLFLVTIVISLSCLAFSIGFAGATPKKGGMITVGMNTDITGTDPAIHAAVVTCTVLNNVIERLVGLSEDLKVIPVLAESWETNADSTVFTFRLRKGKMFHNGREMVADDVKYSFERLKKLCPRKGILDNLDQIEVLDKYTVRFTLKSSSPTLFLNTIANIEPLAGVVPREEVEKQGGTMTHPVGTGPYKFVEWKPDRYVLLERFDGYVPQPGPINGFGGERIAYLDKIKYVPIPEESVAAMALLKGEIDFLERVPFKNVEKFRGASGINVDEVAGNAWYQMFFGLREPITNNLKFRKACAYAIDSELVMKMAIMGYGQVNPSWLTVHNPYYTEFHKKWYPKDIEKAKQLLKESGYNGETIEISASKKYMAMYNIALAVQSELKAIGINAKIKVIDWGAIIPRFYDGKFHILAWGMGTRIDPSSTYFYTKLHGLDEVCPEMVEIKKQLAATADFNKRRDLCERAHQLIYEWIPGVNFYNYNYISAYHNHVKGFKMWSTSVPRFWNVWLDK